MNPAGLHVVADIWLAEMPVRGDIRAACVNAISESGMTVVGDTSKNFSGQGFTGLWLLAESHFSIHTYPERLFIAVDCYACGEEGDPVNAIYSLLSALDVMRSNISITKRGA